MGFLSTIGTAIGGFFGGPTGAALGGGIGGFLGDAGDVVQPYMNSASAYLGQRDTNETNLQIANQANEFSADQARINREFQQASADRQMKFQGDMWTQSRDFNESQARSQMDFQREMSSSSYQRAVQDMKLAGLNPMLAYSQGGASTPSGASGSVGVPSGSSASGSSASASLARIDSPMVAAINTGMAASRLQSDLKTAAAERDLIRANVSKVDQEAKTSAASAGQLDALQKKTLNEAAVAIVEYNRVNAEAKRISSEVDRSRFVVDKLQPLEEKLQRLEVQLRALEVPKAEVEAAYAKKAGMVSPALRDIGRAAGAAADVGAAKRGPTIINKTFNRGGSK